MSATHRVNSVAAYDAWQRELRRAHRLGAKLRLKSQSWAWRVFCAVLWFVGRDDATTVGRWIGLPDDFYSRSDARKAALLCHELVHVRQFRATGLGSPTLGILLMLLAYLLPLPLGLAWGRYRIELAGYVAQGRMLRELGEDVTGWPDYVARRLCGRRYAWAWPFRRRVRDAVAEGVLS